MTSDQAPWRRDTRLAGLLHPEYPDDVQVLLHDGGPRFSPVPPELVWVRLTGRSGADVYRGVLLNQPLRLGNHRQGGTIHLAVASGAPTPVFLSERYLRERADWSVTACNRCGLFDLFDAPSDLIRASFADLPPGVDVLVEFTATCPRCGGTQIVRRREPASRAPRQVPRQPTLARLTAYLRENLILDFQGDLDLPGLRELLRGDDSAEAAALLAKVRDDRGVNDMMIVLADCLLEAAQRALDDDVLREQLLIYAGS